MNTNDFNDGSNRRNFLKLSAIGIALPLLTNVNAFR